VHSIQLKIEDSIFDKVMTMLKMLPQEKIKIEDHGYDYPAVTKDEAKQKVQKAIENISGKNGLLLDEAFDKVLK